MKKRTSFIKLIKLWGIIILIGIGVSIIAIDFIVSHRDFNFRADQMRADYIALQKQIIKQEVKRVVDLISFEKAQSEILTKKKIKSRVYKSYSIAQNIYQQNKNTKSEPEIQKMILDALRPIRFEGGSGYYFASRLDGVEMLFADKPKMEGLNLLDMQDTRGQYVIRDMIEIAQQSGEGFYEYHWTKPHSAGNEFKKISFIKRFEPYDWFIGTGLYVDDVEADIALMGTKLNNQIKNKVLFFILIVMGVAVLFSLLFNWLNIGLNNDFNLFVSFFRRAAYSDEEIDRESIKFVEIDQIAEYANRMLTERKQAEKALQEAYSIINRSPVVAFLWKNLEGWPVEFVSDNVMELFGYAAEEFTSGQISYTETIHPDDLERVAMEVKILSNQKGRTSFVHEPYRIISKDGKVRWLDDRTYIRRDNNGNITHYEGIVVDITDNMHAAEVLRENEEKLARDRKMESLGLLAGGVAHDLNNVLSGIVSYPDLLLLELPEDNQFREAIETIKESGDRAVAIVQDLLTVARGVAITKEPLNLNDLIGDYLHSPEFST